MYTKIKDTIQGLSLETIDPQRKAALDVLTAYIQEKKDVGQAIKLHFICTHNSRRSHLSQVWAQALAQYYKIPSLLSYSGGTQATALFPMAANTLAQQGFKVLAISEGDNPIYVIDYATDSPPIIGFSKTFDHPFNPNENFAAILTCAAAQEDCPFITGAEERIPITYEDPKSADGTPEQVQTYADRSLQIAAELKYVFSNIK